MEVAGMPGHLIRRLHQISTQVFVARARAAGCDITPVQFAALDALLDHPGIDQASVAALDDWRQGHQIEVRLPYLAGGQRGPDAVDNGIER